MRGPKYRQSLRKSLPKQPANEANALPTQVAAPVGGWNARDSLAAMKPTDAIVLDNIFPGTGGVSLRPGKSEHTTGMAGDGESLMPYNSAGGSKLYCGTSVGIYDVTAFGPVGAAESSSTSGYWQHVNVANAGGTFLVIANGVDLMKQYDGAAWTNSAITGLTTSDICNLVLHKRRIWMVENASMSAWYLDTDAIAGAATEFPMGQLFTHGGYIVAQYTWTIDGGQGLDDYLITVTSEGEIAIYQGTDPNSATDWALVGVYYTGQPIGRRCFAKYGGDVLYLSQQGLFPLSKLLLSATLDRAAAISDKISGAFLQSTTEYGLVRGWQITVFPNSNAVLVNLPLAMNNTSYQYVMNNITKAWCRFTGWNSAVMHVFGNNLYAVLGGTVYQLWVGLNDAGVSITGTCAQAYSTMGAGYQKQITLSKPVISITGGANLKMAFDADYRAFGGETQISYVSTGFSADWDAAVWDESVWSATLDNAVVNWATIPNEPGYVHSFRLQMVTDSSTFNWTANLHAFRRAGIL